MNCDKLQLGCLLGASAEPLNRRCILTMTLQPLHLQDIIIACQKVDLRAPIENDDWGEQLFTVLARGGL